VTAPPTCPPGFGLATIDVHQRDPDGTATIVTCLLGAP
jgi:hypothetical protein